MSTYLLAQDLGTTGPAGQVRALKGEAFLVGILLGRVWQEQVSLAFA